ncbi:MAG: VOC family protein [Trueperaceae bacterium]|nr:VOC family protein [Trueperaceae bacterium]
MAATAAFYEDVLGLALVRDQGVCRVYATAPGAYLGFCARGYAVPSDVRVVLTLLVDDVAAAHAALVAAGGEAEGPPRHSDAFRCTSSFFRDPNGYLVELQRFDEPLP